ncbi:hypothetical protein BN7_2034 [Wickerhamomyces ciferrii]|uniref:Reticulon-like protein n=1 Tax=Wickerhamomyces ciferrii (strain ATCC 14091 / BCRC 22168 / CBS 111 / JCM 3599 / NBRC 0793 / NRRL Y-1031 F-60-10) TaxID=1206466 RepID=K0KM80_WICCF|nr:uncharacterized protein BN7_2034 [Wickerhamomyces ciferrii]CCH42489.1 hypothetical protein BN7_2034 [Wickerhamomyces ciferrii]
MSSAQVPQVPVPNGTPAQTQPSKRHVGNPLLTWKDPVKTGKVFGSLVFSLIVLKSVNLLSLFFRLGSIALISSAIAEYAGKLVTGTGFVTRYRPSYNKTFSKKTSNFLESFTKDLPALEEEGQKLLYSFDIENTLKASGLFYILYKITSWLSLYKLIFTATVLTFTLPAIYENYQDEINEAVVKFSAIAREKAGEYGQLAQEKATPYLKQADEKLGPVSKFIKSKYQVRTASTSVGEQNVSAFSSGSEPISNTGAKKVSSSSSKATNPFENVEEAVNQTSGAPSGAKSSGVATSSTSTLDPSKVASSVEDSATGYHQTQDIQTNIFPETPSSEPSLVDQLKQKASEVDVEDLKSDIAANKAKIPNF